MKADRIKEINKVIEAYFTRHTEVNKILAKELMPDFISAGIFSKDNRKGLPIRKILRELDENGSLNLIPYVHPERKEKNTNWYFVRINK